MIVLPPDPGVRECKSEWIEATARVAAHKKGGFCHYTASSQTVATSRDPYGRFKLVAGEYGLQDGPGVVKQLQALLDEMKKRQAPKE